MENLKIKYYKKRYKKEFESLMQLKNVGALNDLSDQQIASRLNYGSHNTGKKIRNLFNLIQNNE